MPELPEVETIRRELDATLPGRRIERVRVFHDDLILGGTSHRGFQRALRGRWIGRVDRRAKYLLIPLHAAPEAVLDGSAPERWMRVQLRMSGQFAVGRAVPDPNEFRHPGVQLELDDGRTVFYDDVRRLGGFDLLTDTGRERLETRLGPEPLGPAFRATDLAAALAGRTAPVKNTLLDQRRIAGIGNIYASEALFRARIDPRRPGGRLEIDEIRALHRAIRRVLRSAIERRGTTVRDYRAVNGRSGSFQTELRVYGREGDPCRRCGTRVVRVVQAGRSTFFCPACQR